MRVGIVGVGAVGARVAGLLAGSDHPAKVVLVGRGIEAARRAADRLGADVEAVAALEPDGLDVVVLAGPVDTHAPAARRALMAGASVVSVSDSVHEVRQLLGLDADARERSTTILVGAGMAPGLSDLLAAHGARELDRVHEIHVAKFGTGGPACARQHHHALGATGVDWRDGRWIPRAGGSGRELCWFPDPVGGADCYRGALPDPLLLAPAFPDATRITARMAATRRDRMTARLPMLRPPHPEGTVGAVRVELRGEVEGERIVRVYGASAAPAIGAAAVAASAVLHVSQRVAPPGAWGLASVLDPSVALADVADFGVRAELFEGKF